jgi:hypothetical protein
MPPTLTRNRHKGRSEVAIKAGLEVVRRNPDEGRLSANTALAKTVVLVAAKSVKGRFRV